MLMTDTMSMQLLLKNLRHINRLVQSEGSGPSSYNDMALAVHEVLDGSVTITDVGGSILGHSDSTGKDGMAGGKLDATVATRLARLDQTAMGSGDLLGNTPPFTAGELMAIPLVAGGRRVGTLVLSRKQEYGPGEQILAEYAATLLSMDMMRAGTAETERQTLRKSAVDQALGALSFSEQEAVRVLFAELTSDEGIVVASRIADGAGLTRSVIVNALRKLESAGVITSRSLGMKGTYIKVLNINLVPAVRAWG